MLSQATVEPPTPLQCYFVFKSNEVIYRTYAFEVRVAIVLRQDYRGAPAILRRRNAVDT